MASIAARALLLNFMLSRPAATSANFYNTRLWDDSNDCSLDPSLSLVQLRSAEVTAPIAAESVEDCRAKQNRSVDRTVHMLNFSDTLQQEVEDFSEIAVTVAGYPTGSVSHFFHFMMNFALPLYNKVVSPFAKGNKSIPRRRIHLPNVGGVCSPKVLQQIFPHFDFVVSEWVPYCHESALRFIGDAPVHHADIPILAIYGDGVPGLDGTPTSTHRHFLMEFRTYILTQMQSRTVPRDVPTRIFLSRSSGETDTARYVIGSRDSAGDKRSIANENELVHALDAEVLRLTNDTRGISMMQLEGSPFAEQVVLFRDSKLVIGQHGAGLLHCLWMADGSALVEISTPSLEERETFKHLCEDVRQLNYRRVFVADTSLNDKHNNVTVPVAKFINDIKDILMH